MTVKSYRIQRSKEIHAEIKRRNEAAGVVVAAYSQAACPVQTTVLRNSIRHVATEDDVKIGFGGVPYGKFVHNGTMDFRHKGEWSEAESGQLLSWKSAQQRRGGSTVVTPPKGLMPRPFLVYGLVQSKPALKRIYGAEMKGKG